MNEIGFTGTLRGMTGDQANTVASLLRRLRKGPSAVLHNGMAPGADYQAAMMAGNLGYRLIGHPGPAGNRTGITFHEVREEFPYLTRNRHIVNESRVMIAAPFGDSEVLRSGTWATVRYAKEEGKPLVIVWPDGSHDDINFDMRIEDL